jgi:hypothetical protein
VTMSMTLPAAVSSRLAPTYAALIKIPLLTGAAGSEKP